MTTTINRDTLLESIADTISDYRADECPKATPQHVNRWIKQFDDDVQLPMLAELAHVFKQTYLPKLLFENLLSSLVNHEGLAGDDPCAFWESVSFLDIQQGGSSQNEMLDMFDEILQDECGLTIWECGSDSGEYLYLDDGIFTGNRFKNDISSWIEEEAPSKAKVYVVLVVMYSNGHYYVSKHPRHKIHNVAANVGKQIEFDFYRVKDFENQMNSRNKSDVLWPTKLPDEEYTQLYAEELRNTPYPPIFRAPNSKVTGTIFSSRKGRHILEQELLKKGAYIREFCPNLSPKQYQRPLGNMVLDGLGFGSLVVTYRNCPNNAPLAFWVSEPDIWYALFPRKPN